MSKSKVRQYRPHSNTGQKDADTKPSSKHLTESKTSSKQSVVTAAENHVPSKPLTSQLTIRKKDPVCLPIQIEFMPPARKSMIKQGKIRQENLLKILGRGGLRKKRMMTEGSQDMELDFLDARIIIDVDAIGSRSRYKIWTQITLGDDKKGETEHTLLFDTGSALTWVSKATYLGARTPEQRQSLTPPETQRDHVRFGYAAEPNLTLTGQVYSDTLDIGDGAEGAATIAEQRFAVVDQAPDNILPGTLACGPSKLCKGTVVGHPNRVYRTVLDNLFLQRRIQAKILGLALRPQDENETANVSVRGAIHFGGTRSEHTLARIPATQISSSSSYYGVDIILKLDPETPGPGGISSTILTDSSSFDGYCPGILDSGAPYIYLERNSLRTYMEKMDAVYDNQLQTWWIPLSMKHKLRNLTFYFNGGAFVFPPSGQVFPPSMNQVYDSRSQMDRIYFVFQELDQAFTRYKYKFIIGLAWIQRYYVAIDLTDPNQTYLLIANSRYTMQKWQMLDA